MTQLGATGCGCCCTPARKRACARAVEAATELLMVRGRREEREGMLLLFQKVRLEVERLLH